MTPSDWTRDENFDGAAQVLASLDGDAAAGAPVTVAALTELLTAHGEAPAGNG